MTANQHSECEKIISEAIAIATFFASNLGLTQIPFVENGPLEIIEIKMIMKLSEVFGINFTETKARETLAEMITGNKVAHRMMIGSLSSTVPILGALVSSGTIDIYFSNLGWKVANDFAANPDKYIAQFES